MIRENLFDTVPAKNYLPFSLVNEADYEKVIDLLEFQKRDVATGADVPLQSVRYDERMPRELKERIGEWANLMQLVAEHFQDLKKTILWFKMPNPLLGYVPPKDMIRFGRYKKLLKFVFQALQENKQG